MEEGDKQSEWNEQQAFSKIFFQLTEAARGFQIDGNVIKWADTIIAKISLVLGISVKEKDDMYQYKKELMNARNNYIKSSNAANKGILYNLCFETEADIDSISNKYMPFLKIKKQDDIGGL